MTVYYTSDTHFGHAKVIGYSQRPFASVEEMDAELIRRWNSVVAPGDTVYHLGDFALGTVEKARLCRSQLNGRIVLVRGNHDGTYTRCRRWLLPTDNVTARIMFVTPPEEGGLVQYVHRPQDAAPEATLVLCGHVHERWRVHRRGHTTFVNVGVDQWRCAPVTLDQIMQMLRAFYPLGGCFEH